MICLSKKKLLYGFFLLVVAVGTAVFAINSLSTNSKAATSCNIANAGKCGTEAGCGDGKMCTKVGSKALCMTNTKQCTSGYTRRGNTTFGTSTCQYDRNHKDVCDGRCCSECIKSGGCYICENKPSSINYTTGAITCNGQISGSGSSSSTGTIGCTLDKECNAGKPENQWNLVCESGICQDKTNVQCIASCGPNFGSCCGGQVCAENPDTTVGGYKCKTQADVSDSSSSSSEGISEGGSGGGSTIVTCSGATYGTCGQGETCRVVGVSGIDRHSVYGCFSTSGSASSIVTCGGNTDGTCEQGETCLKYNGTYKCIKL